MQEKKNQKKESFRFGKQKAAVTEKNRPSGRAFAGEKRKGRISQKAGNEKKQ